MILINIFMIDKITVIKPTKKPIVSWLASGDPTRCINVINNRLTEINIIQTKRLTKEFCDFCLLNVKRIYLHVVISGMGSSIFEERIPSVREMFEHLVYLTNNGFPLNQILVVVKPIIQNDNGLKALELLLTVFTKFPSLRLRHIRFETLPMCKFNGKTKSQTIKQNQWVPANLYIRKRLLKSNKSNFITRSQNFWNSYNALINRYRTIISVDSGDEFIIGSRELNALGYHNSWYNPITRETEKLITYKNGDKKKPICNLISAESTTRCPNRCLLCPHPD